jgi:hypothetical protein
MDASRNASSRAGLPPVRLSFAQKRDLAGIAASAVITSALIVAPTFGPAIVTGGVPSPSRTSLSARVIAPASVATPVGAPRGSIVSTTAAAPAAVPLRRLIASRRVPATAVAIAASGGRAIATAETVEASRKPIGRKLGELFTGDGTYAIRPFPTVAVVRQ